eukprot:75191_1
MATMQSDSESQDQQCSFYTGSTRYTMEDLEGYLDPYYGITILDLEHGRGMKLIIDENRFEAKFPVKIGAFQKKTARFSFLQGPR